MHECPVARVAADLATGLGAAPLLVEIDELARPLPVDPRPRFGLSPRELEVLRVVSAGCSNRQIAEELVIAVKTADRHVSNILAKLCVGNRVQAATIAQQMGDLPDAEGTARRSS